MERNVEDILAELRAKRASAEKPEEQPAPEAPAPADPVPAPQPEETPVTEEPSPLPVEEEPAPLPEPEPEAEPVLFPEEEKPAPEKRDELEETAEKVKKGVDDLYVGSFGEKAYKADRLEKRRARKNRDALVVKESGRTGFFGGLFRLIGFLVVVALTILAVLIGLQFIADVEIIPVRAIVESIIAWLEALLAKWGL